MLGELERLLQALLRPSQLNTTSSVNIKFAQTTEKIAQNTTSGAAVVQPSNVYGTARYGETWYAADDDWIARGMGGPKRKTS